MTRLTVEERRRLKLMEWAAIQCDDDAPMPALLKRGFVRYIGYGMYEITPRGLDAIKLASVR
jgi:hypothetical protein